jgi:SpoVK/Ycf46/Vps4 family AAA+-type ATPase
MEDDNRFMNELFRIVNGALRLDLDKVRNYTAFLADKLEKAGDSASAKRLRKLLQENDHQLRPADAHFARALPADSESRFPLIERINVKAMHEPPLVLERDQWDTVNEFLSVAKSYAQLESGGVKTSLGLLMHGPPGTGKSRLARFVATELDLDLYVARLDGLISSFLGSTAKNIRAIFDFASKTPCVLFLDEFDAIAKLRGDSQELGELKRVVNSFIQNLDGVGPHSIVLAATNHDELLDAAIWRRFSYRLQLHYPSPALRLELWQEFLRPAEFTSRELDLLVDVSDGFTGSDIQEACLRLHRRQVTSGEAPHLKQAFAALLNLATGEGRERRFVAELRDRDPRAVARALRTRNPKRYSAAAVGQLLGVSKATAHRWMDRGVHADGKD